MKKKEVRRICRQRTVADSGGVISPSEYDTLHEQDMGPVPNVTTISNATQTFLLVSAFFRASGYIVSVHTKWLWKIVLLTLAASRGVTDLYPS